MFKNLFSPLMEPIEKDRLLLWVLVFAGLPPIVTSIFYKDIKSIIMVIVLSYTISIIIYCLTKNLKNGKS